MDAIPNCLLLDLASVLGTTLVACIMASKVEIRTADGLKVFNLCSNLNASYIEQAGQRGLVDRDITGGT